MPSLVHELPGGKAGHASPLRQHCRCFQSSALWRCVCAPRLVRSCRSRCAGRLSRRRCAVTAGFIATHLVRRSPGLRVCGCVGHVEAGREPGSWCLPAGPGGPRLAPRHTPSGPGCGVVPGGSPRRQSWAACAAVVLRVWTRSLTRPVSRTVRLAAGCLAGAPGLRVDAGTLSRSLDAVHSIVVGQHLTKQAPEHLNFGISGGTSASLHLLCQQLINLQGPGMGSAGTCAS